MTSLLREVHEVLEQEYVSMYGPLNRVAVEYKSDQIIDVAWALKILRDCKINKISQETREREGLASVLNEFIDGVRPLSSLGESPALTNNGRQLLKLYEDFRNRKDPSPSPRSCAS